MHVSSSLPWAPVAALLFALPWASAHAACVPDSASVVYAETVPVRFVQAPDVLLHRASSRGIRFQCDASESIALRPMFAGLTYVRDIDGVPAYEISPYSPLMTVSFESLPEHDEGLETDMDAMRDSPWFLHGGRTDHWARLNFYSRGGPMRPLPQRPVGSALMTASQPVQFQFEIGYEFHGTTCTLSDANVVLDPISADVLDTSLVGGHKTFDVLMDCGVPGRPVSLEIQDAVDRSNMTDVLAPAAGSDARGVGLQILHQGQTLPMGRVWAHTDSTGASERIPFAARYVRVPSEPLQAGAIVGQAVLVANYY